MCVHTHNCLSQLVVDHSKVLTETTADLAFTLILAVARRVGECIDYVKEGRWRFDLSEWMDGNVNVCSLLIWFAFLCIKNARILRSPRTQDLGTTGNAWNRRPPRNPRDYRHGFGLFDL